jgi:serine/threonine protein kinase
MARSIARQIGEALDYAHQAGLTHGRLRPSKLMLNSDGSVRILGFGLSRVSFSGGEGNGHGIKASHYLSPEQMAGESASAQSDQFALAAVIYQLLAGSQAFPGVGDEVRLDVKERDPQPAEAQTTRLQRSRSGRSPGGSQTRSTTLSAPAGSPP